MSEPVSRTVYQTVINMLTVLSQQGDRDAIAALERADEIVVDFDLVDDESAGEVIMEHAEGTYLVTAHGASFMPKSQADH